MIDYYVVHFVWFLLSCGFGYWMYVRGATIGLHAGVKAASVFLILNGKQKEVQNLINFVNDLSSGNIEKYK